MYELKPDEKKVPVMLYTHTALIRGEAVVKVNVMRVNIWLRTEGAPKYMHLLHPQVVVFGGTPVKPLSYSEIYYPVAELIAFHTLPPMDEGLDYDASEANRFMQEVHMTIGSFVAKGHLRISTQTDLANSLDVARISWMSAYDVQITNPYLPQMPPLHIPLMLVSPEKVSFALA